jgi:hypothetical protein
VTLPFFLAADSYRFGLVASLDGVSSPEAEVLVDLSPGVGEVRCEQWTNGLAGPSEQRRLGFQLVTVGGVSIGNGDYFVYDRATTGAGWHARSTHIGAGSVELIGDSSSLPDGVNFLVLGVDRGASPATAEAAREFLWNEPPFALTRGCTPCSRGVGGSCRIIPLL